MVKAAEKSKLPDAGEAKRGTDGHIAYLLRQAHGAARLAMDAEFENEQLTTPQFLVLNLLDAYAGASGAEIARMAQLTPQTVNLIVRKLEREAMLQRSSHETHGRVLRLELTPEGKTRLQRCKASADKLEARMLALLDKDSEQKVRDWLTAVAVTFLR